MFISRDYYQNQAFILQNESEITDSRGNGGWWWERIELSTYKIAGSGLKEPKRYSGETYLEMSKANLVMATYIVHISCRFNFLVFILCEIQKLFFNNKY